MTTPMSEHLLASTSAELAGRFTGVFSPETVDRYVRESYLALFRTAKIKTFVPVLAGRFAADRLTALAQVKGALPKPVPEVLFVCVHNAGRSQMAAALLHRAGGGRVHVRSAGSAPADQIGTTVDEAMAELGIDLSEEFPKPLTDDVVQAADVVITMGCGDACPVYPGKRYLDWAVRDPHGQPLPLVREIRDEIDTRVQALLAELTVPA
ncbi:arsenate reductase ArsC [soil metagenome]